MENTGYNYKAIITNGKATKELPVQGAIFESGAFTYGNHKSMCLTINGTDFDYDIRYDKRYNGNDKEYIEMFLAEEFWTGENGAWKLVKLEEV